MKNIIKHILKEEVTSKFHNTIKNVLNKLLYVDFINGSLSAEEIYTAHFKVTGYSNILTSNPWVITDLMHAVDMRGYSVNYIDGELYGIEELGFDNRRMISAILLFIVEIFKVTQKDVTTKIRQIINDFLNDRIKEYASENNFNLYEKHDMNW
mgnify:FL=1|jgi:hypothetical protein|tara:strand:+ start:579 stop:1037 length:459 start_codon:yes stop_codon:yes gene_type:complete